MFRSYEFEGEHLQPEQLPRPVGWRLLVGMIKVETKTESGIVLTDGYKKDQEYLRYVGKVLAVGSEVYQHPKFQGGIPLEVREPAPWVKVGDVVVISQYSGQTVHILDSNGDSQKLRLLNDDEILSIIPDLTVLAF